MRKILLPSIAIVGAAIAVILVIADMRSSRQSAQSSPVSFQLPYSSNVVGTGIVEASSTNIAIGTNVSGVVATLYVNVGSDVSAGDPLFTIDDRFQAADVETRRANIEVAKSKIAAAEYELELDQNLAQEDIGSNQEYNRDRYAVATAKAELALAEADLKSSLAALDRYTVRAPLDGRVLQVNAHPGEFADAGPQQEPLILFGSVTPLHVRVNVDESDAWRVREGAAATAYVRSNRRISVTLTFVRFEPYVVPKVSLSGSPTERTDTRVLQVIYSFDPGKQPIYIGQLLDVYIDASESAAANDAKDAGKTQ